MTLMGLDPSQSLVAQTCHQDQTHMCPHNKLPKGHPSTKGFIWSPPAVYVTYVAAGYRILQQSAGNNLSRYAFRVWQQCNNHARENITEPTIQKAKWLLPEWGIKPVSANTIIPGKGSFSKDTLCQIPLNPTIWSCQRTTRGTIKR